MNRTIYLFDTKDWILHYCYEGTPEKIKNLAAKIRDDGVNNYYISDCPNLDGIEYYKSMELEEAYKRSWL